MSKSRSINTLLQMLTFGIMLYFVLNLATCIAFAKFDIALGNAFYTKMSNFGIGTQIYYYIGDALHDAKFDTKYSIMP